MGTEEIAAKEVGRIEMCFPGNLLRPLLMAGLCGSSANEGGCACISGDFNHTERSGKGRAVGTYPLDSHPSEAWNRNEISQAFPAVFP